MYPLISWIWIFVAGTDGCIDQTFTRVFWRTFSDLIGRPLQPQADQRLPSKYRIQWLDDDEATRLVDSSCSQRRHVALLMSSSTSTNDRLSAVPSGYTSVSLVANTRVTSADHWQDVRLIDMETSLSYKCGDVAVILPQTPMAAVHLLAQLLSVENRLHHRLVASNNVSSLTMTVLEVFRDYLNITRVPSRSFFEKLLWFSDDERERERLMEFSQVENIDDLYTYCHRPRRTAIEVLQDFPLTTARLPFDYVFDLFPTIRARSFSIASSPIVHPNRIQLLVAVVRYKTIISIPRDGLCSNYLAGLQPGDHIVMRVSSSSFNLVDDDDDRR